MKALLRKSLRHFGDKYDYDVSYLFELEENAPGTLLRYTLMTPLSQYRRTAPADAYYVAKLVAIQAYDCGPCLRLVCNMAKDAGVSTEVISATIRGQYDGLPDALAQVAHYAQAVVEQNSVYLTANRDAVAALWGEGGLADISLAIAFGGFYPTLKRALGHASACAPVLAELNAAHAAG